MSTSPSDDALDQLWRRLGRPFDVHATVSALIGLSPAAVSQLVGMAVATSPEATQLLDAFPSTVRALATSIHTKAERCVGSLRGPVLWSETMAARASSFGDDGLFVCMTPSRAYDIDENQVLVTALTDVRDAAADAEAGATDGAFDEAVRREARRNGSDAGRFVSHPSLQRVTRQRPKARALKRTRSGKHHRSYAPALAMLARTADPIDAGDLRRWSDARTRAQHAALMGLVDRLEARAGRLPDFRVEGPALYAGPVQYRHGRAIGDHAGLSGILIGDLLVDVPDRLGDPNRARADGQLRQRAGRRRSMVVRDEADLDRAIALAIELANT